jgi:hypothetical protein
MPKLKSPTSFFVGLFNFDVCNPRGWHKFVRNKFGQPQAGLKRGEGFNQRSNPVGDANLSHQSGAKRLRFADTQLKVLLFPCKVKDCHIFLFSIFKQRPFLLQMVRINHRETKAVHMGFLS